MNAMHGGTLKTILILEVGKLSFQQEVGGHLMLARQLHGPKPQRRRRNYHAHLAAENLRCDYNNLTIANGAARYAHRHEPNYTALTSTGAQVKPDSVSIELNAGCDKQR